MALPKHDARGGLLLRVLLSLLIAGQAIAGFLPGPLLWGFNHLAYLPLPFRLLWPLVGLTIIWTSLGGRVGRWLTGRGAELLLGRKAVAYVLLPALGALVFWALRCKTYFLGDGWLLGEMVSAGVPFHGYDFVHYRLMANLWAAMQSPGEANAFRVFAWTSLGAGVLYLVTAAWAARSLGKNGGERILLYALLLFYTPVQMFMCYVECYSILTVSMLLFLVTTVLHYRGRVAMWVPGTALGLGLALHLTALFLAPLLLALVFWPAASAPRSVARRFALAVVPAMAVFGVAVGLYFLAGYDLNRFREEFLRGGQLSRFLLPLTGEDGALSLRHLRDIVNLLLLVAPIPFALLVTAAVSRRHSSSTLPGEAVSASRGPVTARRGVTTTRPDSARRVLPVLAASSLWLVLLMSLINMKLGMPRDWDLLAAHTSVFVLAGWLSWPALSPGRPDHRVVGSLVITALLLSMPWFLLNAGESRSVRRFRDVIGGQSRFVQAYGHEEMAKYYRKQGNTAEAMEEYEACARAFPENARFCAVLGGLQYNEGLREAALANFSRALRADSTFAQALEMLANIHAERGEMNEALLYARKLAGVPKESAASAALHGALAEKVGLIDEAVDAYQRATMKDPGRSDLLQRIGVLSMQTGDFGRSERSFRALLGIQPSSVEGRKGLAAALWHLWSSTPGSRDDPLSQERLRTVLRIIDGLIAEGQADAQLTAWREKAGERLEAASLARTR
ncbi:MAG: tetratricopeptide repeat protein [Candidatus Eisenbacteria bacterium]